ncbi:beta-galactosidase [Tunturiibacter gelidiferens]
MARVEAFFFKLAAVVRPHLAPNGGPVVLVQVENEYTNVAKRYGEEGQEYLRWIVELAKRVGLTSVPTTTCEGGAQGAIETSNGFTISPERIASVRKSHPGTPLLWTELYPAWYKVWGGRNPIPRDAQGDCRCHSGFCKPRGLRLELLPVAGRNKLRTPFHVSSDDLL